MAIAFRSATTAQGGPSTVINVPAGTVNGDVLLLFGSNAGPYAYTTPTGWTLLENPVEGGDGETALFYRIASSEPASYTLTAAGNIGDIVTMVCYSGATGGVRSHSQSVVSPGTSGSPVAPSGVIATDMVVHFMAGADAAQNTTNIVLTPPGGSWNTRVNLSYAKGGANTWGSAVAVIDQLGSSATPTTTSNQSVGWPIASVALMLTATSLNIAPTGIASGEAFGTPTVTVGVPTPASGPLRRFDPIEKVVKDTRSQALDAASTALARLGTHTHPESSIAGLITDLSGKAASVHTHPPTDITSAILHEARYEQHSNQTFANTTDTKIQFDTAVTTCSDVTASGTGNTDFTLVRAGLWRISAATAWVAATGTRYLALQTGSTIDVTKRFTQSSLYSTGTKAITCACSTDIRVAANTVICATGWQDSGGSSTTDTFWGGVTHIAMTWLRP